MPFYLNTCLAMKRIAVFRNGHLKDGKIIAVTDERDLGNLLEEAGCKLGIDAKIFYSPVGAILDDVNLVRDDDLYYVSEGEPFRSPLRPTSVPHSSGDSVAVKGPVHKPSSDTDPQTEWVTLNVGGRLFTTTRSTLTQQDPDSMLARMFSGDKAVSWCSSVDETGAYLIDRSPRYFEPVINYLRHGRVVIDQGLNAEGVLEEAKFYGLRSMIDQVEDYIEKNQRADDNTPISRRELVLRLLSTPTDKELRCQGMDFTGANLSKLDLRYINFKYAVLKNANLAGANLSYCNFERADLSHTKMDSANLLGAKMLCANLEGASLRGCNFEDPAGSRANMEGALMKNVDLEGSHMAGVNLRVATLKNANLQNCDLRGAVLAGADLENCDLSGCDLQEANLRGANLKGAAFELMLNPLHMAQTVR